MSEIDARELSGDLKQHERLNKILDVLADQGRISVHDAVEAFNVSGATIRRDLDHLASRQLLRRTRGGAVAMLAYDLPLGYKADKSVDARQRIGALAAASVEAGDVVGIAGGHLALEVARALSARPEFVDQIEVITIVTNSVNVAYELSTRPHIKLLVTGGAVRPRSFSMAGDIAKDSIRRYRFDRLFLEVDGLTAEGPSVKDDVTSEFLSSFVERSQRTIVIADENAIGVAAFATVCSMDRVSSIITDSTNAPDSVGNVAVTRV
ncbi:Glycerol-3-phosphate regulon repressor [Microbacterium hydrocarbonoxydans]|uniref:Glycerol-3-phosphate regulon repressor n=1 Tax=Microbacterium hydrocarbonoxydans TaxID=273678 RepID=A0A0M2HMD4_9MICO|nr:DeoR/GlpR family DNA-binding transcription regulator [Microbacterium hydrocarbonoxydans]KJL47856.1 Glycerol-3-phosphate regulon repressor [Microbacterium hydrocarbonoxydans]